MCRANTRPRPVLAGVLAIAASSSGREDCKGPQARSVRTVCGSDKLSRLGKFTLAAKRFRHLEALHSHDRQRVRRACGPAFSKSGALDGLTRHSWKSSKSYKKITEILLCACVGAILSRQASAQAMPVHSTVNGSRMSAWAIRSRLLLRMGISMAPAAATRQ